MTLYEMSETAKQLYDLLEAGEIDEQTVNDTMESLGTSEKLESYVYIQRQLESEIAGFKAEIDRMTERKKNLEKQVERMKNAQIAYMQAAGMKSANAGTFKLSLRENRSCEIIDAAKIPAEYLRQIPATTEPDKKAMLAALKDGKQIDGVNLKSSFSVMVK